jgi:hypothetical protein
MMARLTQQLAAMRTYESEGLQSKARRIIPVKELGEKARNREDAATSSFADRLLLELLHWFKHSFFSWVSLTDEGEGGGEGLAFSQPRVSHLSSLISPLCLFPCRLLYRPG